MDIREYLANNRLITDGAMGTWYDRLTGYKGNLAERANLENPQQIRDIHRAYIEAGAQLIRTNTFAVNSMFFSADEIEGAESCLGECLSGCLRQRQRCVDCGRYGID